MTSKKDYTVGYGRPPESGKIKKGEVRNAAGRGGKKSKEPGDFWETMLHELERQMSVSVNGKRRKVTPIKLGATLFARRVAEGDPKAIKDLLANLRHLGGRAETKAGDGVFHTPAHKLTMESIVRRIRSMDPIGPPPSANCIRLIDGAGI